MATTEWIGGQLQLKESSLTVRIESKLSADYEGFTPPPAAAADGAPLPVDADLHPTLQLGAASPQTHVTSLTLKAAVEYCRTII